MFTSTSPSPIMKSVTVVTIFSDRNGDFPDFISNKAEPENSDQGVKSDITSQKKVQVKLPTRQQRNVILAQFSIPTHTDHQSVSCVREES